MATYADNDRPRLLDNILFENLIKNNKSHHFDDFKLKRLSSILSNVPYNMLKQSYDSYQKQNKVNETSATHHHQMKTENESRLRKHSVGSPNNDDDDDGSENRETEKPAKKREQSPNYVVYDKANQIVIHVCDEAKQLKRDFNCPRDLLIKEMKYFSYNINLGTSSSGGGGNSSSMAKRTLDDMDISVHCDINIFDWLMRYVKRHLIDDPENAETENKEPKLEITNCVSILISSDFLVMPDLVDKCVKYMIENFNQILQIPCNMNTINDKLITKIAAFIKITTLDELIDKKDKFKAKLFMKKIEFLFDVDKFKQQFEYNEDLLGEHTNMNHYDIYENDCSTLFRCKICGRLMTQRQSKYIKCKLGLLDKHGNYNYFHLNDEKFDVNAFIVELKERLKTWQHVFWFLWALIKCSKCQQCKEWFRFVDFNKCSLNSDNSECSIHGKGSLLSALASSSSSQKRNTCTCIYKDHLIEQTSFQSFYECKGLTSTQVLQLNKHLIDELLKHKDVICYGNGLISLQNVNNVDGSISFSNLIENHFTKLNGELNPPPPSQQQQQTTNAAPSNFFIESITGKHISFFNKYYLNLITLSQNTATQPPQSSDNVSILASDITLYLKLIQNLDPLNVFNSQEVLAFLKADSKKKWDQTKPARWNQDNQREDDMRRFREICAYIFKLRFVYDQAILSQTAQSKGRTTKTTSNIASGTMMNSLVNSVEPPPGGFYYRIENEWKSRAFSNIPAYNTQVSATSVLSSSNAYQTNVSALSYTNPSIASSISSNLSSIQNINNANNFNFLTSKTIGNSSNYANNNNNGSSNPNNKLRQGAVATISKFSNN